MGCAGPCALDTSPPFDRAAPAFCGDAGVALPLEDALADAFRCGAAVACVGVAAPPPDAVPAF
ncbi:hypothetical protein D3273_11935 [Lichenibacterium minor]|uniref:Uncharacterized protein n=1 Tax=Lichenibacterium minor TaxID=2316528 RepID=A0A4Q2U9J3_9HYPH|nr:hypothetical protein [Lichenibacterium minor]RYC31831.1 hypothetical protein D3273_11935 [Lichenibacterium minor]